MSDSQKRQWVKVRVYRADNHLHMSPVEPGDPAFQPGQCWLICGHEVDHVCLVSITGMTESSAQLRLIDGQLPAWDDDGACRLQALRASGLEQPVQTPANQESES